MVGDEGLGHVQRPRNFAIDNIVIIGRFPSNCRLAVFTSDLVIIQRLLGAYIDLIIYLYLWWAMRDLNLRPRHYQ